MIWPAIIWCVASLATAVILAIVSDECGHAKYDADTGKWRWKARDE